jgi:hypothetical protein
MEMSKKSTSSLDFTLLTVPARLLASISAASTAACAPPRRCRSVAYSLPMS